MGVAAAYLGELVTEELKVMAGGGGGRGRANGNGGDADFAKIVVVAPQEGQVRGGGAAVGGDCVGRWRGGGAVVLGVPPVCSLPLLVVVLVLVGSIGSALFHFLASLLLSLALLSYVSAAMVIVFSPS